MIEIKNLRFEKLQNPWDVRVDRANKILGNPFYMVYESQRDIVCDKYTDWFKTEAQNSIIVKNELNRLKELYNKYGVIRIFCWCSPKRCHAETIRDYLLASICDGK
jgi:hypothetical protein